MVLGTLRSKGTTTRIVKPSKELPIETWTLSTWMIPLSVSSLVGRVRPSLISRLVGWVYLASGFGLSSLEVLELSSHEALDLSLLEVQGLSLGGLSTKVDAEELDITLTIGTGTSRFFEFDMFNLRVKVLSVLSCSKSLHSAFNNFFTP